MFIKRILPLCVAVLFGFAAFPSYSGDIISCNGFESCPTVPSDEILAMKARIDALEALLAGTTRGIDPNTSQDTLTFDNSISSEATAVRQLSTTEEEGNLPVCFNGAGELLPCADGVEPPPPVDPYLGSWTGRMIYDRRSGETCHDADVRLNVAKGNYSDLRWKINSTTVIRDTGGLAVSDFEVHFPETGFAIGTIWVFGGPIDFNLQFISEGSAQGYWNYGNDDCYGQWSFTKD